MWFTNELLKTYTKIIEMEIDARQPPLPMPAVGSSCTLLSKFPLVSTLLFQILFSGLCRW